MKALTRNQWIAVAVALVVVGVSYVTGQSLMSMFGGNNKEKDKYDQRKYECKCK